MWKLCILCYKKNNRKYVILVSDGLTRLFTQNNELKTIYYQLGNYSDRSNYEGGPTGWSLARNGRDGNYNIPDNLTWDEWWQKVNEYVEADQDTFVQSYEPYGVNVPYSRISSEIENGTFVYVPHDDKERRRTAGAVHCYVKESYRSVE